MELPILMLKIVSETEIENLRNIAMLLVKCISSDKAGGGYRVVNDHNPTSTMYTGSRENCIAFVKGYDAAPLTDVGCFDPSVNCVCVDTPSCMIVIPENRFGESLGNVGSENTMKELHNESNHTIEVDLHGDNAQISGGTPSAGADCWQL